MSIWNWSATHDADRDAENLGVIDMGAYSIEGQVEADSAELAEAAVREARGFDGAWDVYAWPAPPSPISGSSDE